MKQIAIYKFHFQPEIYRFSFFDTGKDKPYFIAEKARNDFDQLIETYYKPWLSYFEKNTELKVSANFSGSFLVFLVDKPELLERTKKLVKSGRIELILSPFAQSLSSVFSKTIFNKEILMQQSLLNRLFDIKKTGFINTSLLYSNDLAQELVKKNLQYCAVPKIEWFLPTSYKAPILQSVAGALPLILVGSIGNGAENVLEFSIQDGLSKDGLDGLTEELFTSQRVIDLIPNKLPEEIYSLPELVAQDLKGNGIGYLQGNSLQKDFLNRLKEVSTMVAKSADNNILSSFLWLGSEKHFQILSNNTDQRIRYTSYIILLNMLYDIELKLR